MAMNIEWSPTYSVGVADLDRQHQALVALIRQLQDAIAAGSVRAAMAPLLASIRQYIDFHFRYEEQLLEKHGYAGLAAHKEEHARLIEQYQEMEQKYVNGFLHAGAPLLQFLYRWLTDHICIHDKAYAAHLASRGVS